MKITKYALISLYDKKNLSNICKLFTKYNIGLISTGATAGKIKELGYNCYLVSNLTKFDEILDGRVKTLHPKIHASLLYKRDEKKHIDTFSKLKFPIIDYVIVNLYPFEKTVKENSDKAKCIEMIDIGGYSLLRSAAKNFNFVTAVVDNSDYPSLIKNIKENKGKTSLEYRRKMAIKVFRTTSKYDEKITKWFSKGRGLSKKTKKINLKYGENPNQKSFFYQDKKIKSIFDTKIQGREISHNNILDLDAGLNCVNEFSDPTCVIIKHNNPCAVASGKTIYEAYKHALASDVKSSFGGIVILNRSVNLKLAKIISKNFFDIVAAKKYDKHSLLLLQIKKKLILIETDKLVLNVKKEIKHVIGGQLIQEKNFQKIKRNDLKCVSNTKTSKKNIEDLVFALKVSKHVKSNSIVIAKNKKTIGIGAGQMSRLDATKIAIQKTKSNKNIGSFVVASDAFFPFVDNVRLLIQNNCCCIVQPKGSINDNKIIEYVNKKKIPLYFVNYRLFKH